MTAEEQEPVDVDAEEMNDEPDPVSLGTWDGGEAILNGRLKIKAMELLHQEPIAEDKPLVMVLEIRPDTKTGATVKRIDGVLTRVTTMKMSRLRRVDSNVDGALLNQVMEWMASQDVADDPDAEEPFDFEGAGTETDVDADVVALPVGDWDPEDAQVVDES